MFAIHFENREKPHRLQPENPNGMDPATASGKLVVEMRKCSAVVATIENKTLVNVWFRQKTFFVIYFIFPIFLFLSHTHH
jgi:hypothetical protein